MDVQKLQSFLHTDIQFYALNNHKRKYGKLIEYNDEKLTIQYKGLIGIINKEFWIKDIKQLQQISQQSKSNSENFIDIEIANVINDKNNIKKEIAYYDLDKYDNIKLNLKVPKNYNQFEVNEKLTGKKSDYNFSKYTINIGDQKNQGQQLRKNENYIENPNLQVAPINLEEPQAKCDTIAEMKSNFKRNLNLSNQTDTKITEVVELVDVKAKYSISGQKTELQMELTVQKQVNLKENQPVFKTQQAEPIPPPVQIRYAEKQNSYSLK
ncbi:hypothetical protein SS50377_23498 [Spironucleus salmonicida]|uniref:Uncharacterized protein n=1 Tax=Spironucleus salmonicida TaxID=348837 RepID=V6LRC3_9EUKA|nr:hypothetical protein SS50377_23498 [Spironucleus salmonicida]|eukprot:EST46236.1 Hypothetical protein SS50377_13832 [Spironucleus salmonicida]